MRKIKLLSALFLITALCASQARAFDETYVRYIPTSDLLRVLQQKFPHADAMFGMCRAQDVGPTILGYPSPVTGEPVIKTPSPAFVKWYAKCLQYITREEVNYASMQRTESALIGELAFKSVSALHMARAQQRGFYSFTTLGIEWDYLHDRIQESIISHLIDHLIGPGIVADQAKVVGQIADTLAYRTKPKTLNEALVQIVFLVAMRDEFLTY